MKKRFSFLFIVLLIGVICISAVGKKNRNITITNVQLGKMLFFDSILSGDQTISCASCHQPQFAFADTLAFSKGTNQHFTKRNTPSVMNMASREALFWDGRANTLEQQALFPIADVNEMNCPIPVAVNRLQQNKKYAKLFKQVFNSKPTAANLSQALAAYQRTLETGNTPNDRWINDLPNGLTEQQLKGREIFFNKGKCIECHFTPDFTGDEYKNIGLFDGAKYNDSGRYLITKKTEDIGKFKVPGLRNCAITAPYMHDGSLATLRQVIDFYNTPEKFLHNTTKRDTLLQQPLLLTEQEIIDLESFLHGLTTSAKDLKNYMP